MAIKLRVQYSDGREEVAVANARDVVMSERHFKGGFSESNQAESGFFMAYTALKRLGRFEGNFDQFLDSVDLAERVEDEEDATDPTRTEATPSGSSD